MASISKDRRGAIIDSGAINGIDFVEVASRDDQQTLRVHFLNSVDVSAAIDRAEITGGQSITTVPVRSIQAADWALDGKGRRLLTLHTLFPGDFSTYTLKLVPKVPGTPLDSFFDHARFSFKALCPSLFDCETPEPPCQAPEGDLPPINYLAKDYLSFRAALSDFSALRYPEWVERSEADFGMMFLEALASLADDLSYMQDRVAAEANIETASERRSLVRLAGLVDYNPRPAIAARTLLQFTVNAGSIPAGIAVSAPAPDGGVIYFETGTGLADRKDYDANSLWNAMEPYYFDDSQRCLEAGSTEMWLVGHGLGLNVDQQLLIDTPGLTTADHPRRQLVTLTEPSIEETDPVSFTNPPGAPALVTHIFWGENDALEGGHDLTRTLVKGNIVPATQGLRVVETFAIDTPPASAASMPLAIVRTGANATPQYLYTLNSSPLAWLAEDDPESAPVPEIRLEPILQTTGAEPWTWRNSLLDAELFEKSFAVDPARYSPIARDADGRTTFDYDGDGGDTIRFGDGVFGEIPDSGGVFQMTYRTGGGAAGNVAAGVITRVAAAGILAVTNPFPASGGSDPEPVDRIRRLAPSVFRAKRLNAVIPLDYENAAKSLDWVQQAGTVFRWTGSWMTVFTTADPKGTERIPVNLHIDLINLLNRRRLAGYESYAPAAKFVSVDLQISVCARNDAFRGDVQAGILRALSTLTFGDGTTGFFAPDRFTFGIPLERSALEAAIQEVPGVGGILSIDYRRRDQSTKYGSMLDQVTVGFDEIIRVNNDPNTLESGSLKVTVEGGK